MGTVECAVNCSGNEYERLENSLGADTHNHSLAEKSPSVFLSLLVSTCLIRPTADHFGALSIIAPHPQRDTKKEANRNTEILHNIIINLRNKKTRTIQHNVLHYIKGKGTHKKTMYMQSSSEKINYFVKIKKNVYKQVKYSLIK